MAEHDLSYRHLFSHPDVVRDLISSFTVHGLAAQLDFAALRRENASYVSDALRSRHGDIVWRIPLARGGASVHVLLEFQSGVDRNMAVRMLSYAGLHYQDLYKTGGIPSGDALPRVLPIVLYTGERQWDAPDSTTGLIQRLPAELESFQPRMQYLLIDAARYPRDELAHMRNLAAAVFRLEHSRTSDEVEKVIDDLNEWKLITDDKVRAAFITWLHRVIMPRHAGDLSPPELNPENTSMSLAEAAEDFRRKYRNEGRVEGLRQGQLEGRIEGRLEGRLDGEREILLRQLRKRFGELPLVIVRQVETASTDELGPWAERLLDARALADVFGFEPG